MARDLATVNELNSIELENTVNINTNSAVSNEVNKCSCVLLSYLGSLLSSSDVLLRFSGV